MNFEAWFQTLSPQITPSSVGAVLGLQKEGATVPFMARYRKEATGNLDEVAIQKVLDGKENWDEIVKRKTFILKEIENQEKLTPELKKILENTYDLALLEDLYLPYKKKRKTKAQKARDLGLEPLADLLWHWGQGLQSPIQGKELAAYVKEMCGQAKDDEAAVGGAMDILIERISEIIELRQSVRQSLFQKGILCSQKGEKAKNHSKFKDYFEYRESIPSLQKAKNTHRYLALRRGQNEGELKLRLQLDETEEKSIIEKFQKKACPFSQNLAREILCDAASLAYKNYVFPSISTEVHQVLKTLSDETAISVFAENVRKVLLESPFGAKPVLGIDPGIRTGCKTVVIDDSGKYVLNFVFKTQGQEEKSQAVKRLKETVPKYKIAAIAIGNGTGGRETETFLREIFSDASIPIVLVNEAGASIYSASERARKEFPQLDLTVRGAISIARRLQDPLAELVKIDPKSIGVGQYQHDVSQPALKKGLEQVVDSCVNSVGVNLNTASLYLLSHVSGIGPVLATNIVDFRHQKGLFSSRKDLLNISRFSQKVFEQAAGFLRLPQGKNPLDRTGIHPERYPALESLARELGVTVQDFLGQGIEKVRSSSSLKEAVGKFTFEDILQELEKPGRDPREEFTPFHFREDIQTLADLRPQMLCPGVITNVTNFGAFVDIGVHQDGLVHVSELADRFVKDPSEVVAPGDRVQVRVIDLDPHRKRISLSLKKEGSDKKASQEKRPQKPLPEKKAKTPSRKRKPKAEKRKPPAPPTPQKMTHRPFAALANLKTPKKS